jgi:serine/threonine-protein kinase RsbW
MAQLRSATRALRAHAEGPASLVRVVHDTWEHLGLHRMATAVFAELDLATGDLRMASAGHPAPLVVDGAKAWFPAFEPGAPFGAPVTDAPEWTGQLPSGNALVFYTDGLVEDRQRDIDDGTRRLMRAAVAAGTTVPDQLADAVLDSLVAGERADDVALLVVRRTPRQPSRR